MTKIPFSPSLKTLSVVALSASLLAGCGGIPSDHPALQRARAAYGQAQANPEVTANAPLALHEAEQALKAAENAKNVTELEQLAYVAERKAQVAVTTAERKGAEQDVEKLGKEKDRVVLDAREREIDKKVQEAEVAKRQAEEALARARELEKELAELQGKQTDRGLVLTVGDVLFETAKADLMAAGLRNLDKIAEFLVKNPQRNVLVEGHTDSRGGDSYNLELSERRANSVRLALIQRGVAPERIIARGFGKAMPIASNDSETGRQQNRRVEIVILNEGDTVNFR
jgi:outer membrane protein OmpA-like peptidoglycan-associated protein